MIFTLLNIVVHVITVCLMGFIFGRRQARTPNMDFINYVNVHVFCPSLIFSALLSNPVDLSSGWALIVAGTLVIVLPGIILHFMQPAGISRQAFLVPGMFRNTGNVGIPLMMLAYGKEHLGDIVLLFVLSNSLHFSLGLFLLSGKGNRWLWLKNPNVWAAVFGILLAPYKQYIPGFVETSVDMLGQITIPLMLFSLGVRLSHDKIAHIGLALRINLLYLVAGAICLPLIIFTLPLTADWTRFIIMAAMLPPAVLNYLLCEHYKVEPQTVASIVLLGNVISVVTMPIVIWLTLVMV